MPSAIRRRIFRDVKRFSLLLCALTILLWISTYLCTVQLGAGVARESDGQMHPLAVEVLTSRGELTFEFGSKYVFTVRIAADQKQVDALRMYLTRKHVDFHGFGRGRDYFGKDDSLISYLGFRLTSSRISPGPISLQLTVCDIPIWPLALLFAILPAARPTPRLVKAVWNAPPPAARKRSERWIAGLAMICLALFLLSSVTIFLTRKAGWSVRFARTRGTLVELGAQNRRLHLTLIGDWPESQPLAFMKLPDEYHLLYPFREGNTWLIKSQSFVGISWSDGLLPFFLDEDGSLAHLPYGKNPYFMRTLAGLPFHQIQISLFEMALPCMLVFAAWAVAQIRGRVKRYVVVKDSLCTHCGYALAGNTSGVCPECGSVIANAQKRSSRRAAEIAEKDSKNA